MKAVIFDMDGTLLDFEILSHEALNAVLIQRFGNQFEFDWLLHAKNVGRRARGPDSWAQVAIDTLKIPSHRLSAEEYADEVEKYLEPRIHDLALMTGAEELFRKLVEKKINVGIATSSNRKCMETKLKKYPFLTENVVIVCGDDPEVKRGKPHPDIFLECAKRMGLDVSDAELLSQVVVFEDSPGGIEGAVNAGMFAVAVPDKRLFSDQALLEEKFQRASLICKNGLPEFTDEVVEMIAKRKMKRAEVHQHQRNIAIKSEKEKEDLRQHGNLAESLRKTKKKQGLEKNPVEVLG